MPDNDCDYTRPGETAQFLNNNELIGMVGMVAPSALQNFGLNQTVYIAEINIDSLFPLLPETKQSKPIPKYPAVYRDFTIIIDKEVASGKILTCVEDAQEKLVESTFLFDVFEGNPIPEDKKSISFRITYRSTSRTLADEEVNQIHQKISGRLLKSFDATLPV
jgi:phenylalanyl-tRNA synthetase beta chain